MVLWMSAAVFAMISSDDAWGLWFRFRVCGMGCGIQGLGFRFRVCGMGCGIQGLGFWIYFLGSRVEG